MRIADQNPQNIPDLRTDCESFVDEKLQTRTDVDHNPSWVLGDFFYNRLRFVEIMLEQTGLNCLIRHKRCAKLSKNDRYFVFHRYDTIPKISIISVWAMYRDNYDISIYVRRDRDRGLIKQITRVRRR